MVFLVAGNDGGHLTTTGTAPRRPEVYEHVVALTYPLAELHVLVVHVLHGELLEGVARGTLLQPCQQFLGPVQLRTVVVGGLGVEHFLQSLIAQFVHSLLDVGDGNLVLLVLAGYSTDELYLEVADGVEHLGEGRHLSSCSGLLALGVLGHEVLILLDNSLALLVENIHLSFVDVVLCVCTHGCYSHQRKCNQFLHTYLNVLLFGAKVRKSFEKPKTFRTFVAAKTQGYL